MTGRQAGRRLDVKAAADELGLSVEAVRKRIARGTLRSEKGPDGTRYVCLDEGPDGAKTSNGTGPDGRADALLDAKDETIAELRERVEQLSRIMETRDEELRRKDHLLAAALERIPELEAPRDEPHAPETASEEPEEVETPAEVGGSQAAPQRRSWWRRFFGFE